MWYQNEESKNIGGERLHRVECYCLCGCGEATINFMIEKS